MRHPIFFAVIALAAVGCASRPFVAATPKSFVELNDQTSYDYRATTPEGVVIAVRALDNDPKGDLAFWTQAITRKLRNDRGYALLEQKDVHCAGGLKGIELRFGHDRGTLPHSYSIAIFVTDKRIFLIEAGGTKDEMERYADSIDWSVRSFRPK